jgi:gluconokinase
VNAMKVGGDRGQPKDSASKMTAVVVMGVTGCGKSAVGTALAKALHVGYIEGDKLHPAENVARMARGEPLTDALREGWLQAVGEQVHAAVESGEGAVAACSALKRIYRDKLRASEPGIAFIHLAISPEAARKRVARRRGHFMPASLVDSQFAALEPPGADENALSISAEMPIAEIVEAAKAFLALRRNQPTQ